MGIWNDFTDPEKGPPMFEAMRGLLSGFLDDVLGTSVDRGIITPEQANEIREVANGR